MLRQRALSLGRAAMSLRADGVSCTRAGRTLFGGLHLEAAPGSALWVRGANGSGKTSLLRLLCGLARPDVGTVRWHGKDIRADRAGFHAGLLYIGHAAGLKGDLLAWENLAFGGPPLTREEACGALDAAGLSDWAEAPVRSLSEGQRKRVALARLQLAQDRPLWLLDEPFTSLDGRAAEGLRAALHAYVAGGGTLVYTTHQDVDLPNTVQLDMDRWARC